ncbi:3109_t:CDS:2, partial [Paraglomus occultum]
SYNNMPFKYYVEAISGVKHDEEPYAGREASKAMQYFPELETLDNVKLGNREPEDFNEHSR